MSETVSAACARGSHRSCRGRALATGEAAAHERWVRCECGCGHQQRGQGQLTKRPQKNAPTQRLY